MNLLRLLSPRCTVTIPSIYSFYSLQRHRYRGSPWRVCHIGFKRNCGGKVLRTPRCKPFILSRVTPYHCSSTFSDLGTLKAYYFSVTKKKKKYLALEHVVFKNSTSGHQMIRSMF
ncbi:hypothetical protein ABKN59_011633 [Abortiporus biennis]